MSFSNRHTAESSSSYSPPQCRQFTFPEIEHATQNFDESLVIGRGGFGRVYKGTITHGNTQLDVAIKRLESGSSQGAVEFWAEIETLSNLRHCHLVSLIGYCSDGQEKILVYEYMLNGTLADRLHKRPAPLTWVRRLKICIGAARGLDYLHTGTGIKHGVIHRDVKSTNILLDKNWAAKISDFGLSKIGPTNQPLTYVSTLVKGTLGYLDPDYYQTGRLTRKSDVYAFGVVLFEVLCGKQAIDRSIDEEQWGLAPWALDSIKEGRLKEIVDYNLRGVISSKCLKKFSLIAGRCLHSHPKQRPTMAEVVVGLESVLDLQEKTKSALLIKLYGKRVPASIFPPNPADFAGGTSSKSLDLYLYIVGEDRIVHQFDFNTVLYATESFSEANKISIRRHESMYKGRLQNGQDITILQDPHPHYLFEKCINEASILLKLEHENVIQLLGYCIRETELYLLYDFATYAALESLIFDPMRNLLDWNKRCKIILGVASALVYLHHHAPIQIIHRDLTPSTILLDESFHPKLFDFRHAVAVEDESEDIETKFYGTLGYSAPEYIIHGRLSSKADVYSFGVLVLNMVTGQRAFELTYEHVYRNWLEETILDIIDPRVDGDPVSMTKYMEIALLCVQGDATVRPTMEEVVDMLLGTLSLTLPVSEMRARMNPKPVDSGEVEEPADLDGNDYEGSDTGEIEEFILELCPR